MDFRLKVFASVCRHLSLTKAAKEMHLTQPAVTRHIQELEKEYQTSLLERKNNRIRLTPAGRMLQEHARTILERYDELAYEMSRLQEQHAGQLHLGASSTIAQYVLPGLLAKYTELFPQIQVSLLNGNSADIEQALDEHRIDLGLVEGLSRQTHLRYTPFLDDELVAIVSARSGQHWPESLHPAQLAGLPLVLREQGSGTLEVLEEALRSAGIRLDELNIRMHLGSTESIKSFLDHSGCMAIVSIRSVAGDLYRGRFKVIDLGGLSLGRSFQWVHQLGVESKTASHFFNFAEIHKISL